MDAQWRLRSRKVCREGHSRPAQKPRTQTSTAGAPLQLQQRRLQQPALQSVQERAAAPWQPVAAPPSRLPRAPASWPPRPWLPPQAQAWARQQQASSPPPAAGPTAAASALFEGCSGGLPRRTLAGDTSQPLPNAPLPWVPRQQPAWVPRRRPGRPRSSRPAQPGAWQGQAHREHGEMSEAEQLMQGSCCPYSCAEPRLRALAECGGANSSPWPLAWLQASPRAWLPGPAPQRRPLEAPPLLQAAAAVVPLPWERRERAAPRASLHPPALGW